MIIRDNRNYISVLLVFLLIAVIFQNLIPIKYRIIYFIFIFILSLIFHFIQKVKIAKAIKIRVFKEKDALIFIVDKLKFDIFEEFIIVSSDGVFICRTYMPIQNLLKSILQFNTMNEYINKTESIFYKTSENIITLQTPNNIIRFDIPKSIQFVINQKFKSMNYDLIEQPDANNV